MNVILPRNPRLRRRRGPLSAGLLAALAIAMFGACKGDPNAEAAPDNPTPNAAAQPAPPPAPGPEPGGAEFAEPAGGGAPPAPSDASAPSEGTPPSSAELDRFARALTQIRTVRREFTDKIASADDTDKAKALQAEATRQIEAKLEASGLDAKQYERIAKAVTDDPALQADVDRRIRELQ